MEPRARAGKNVGKMNFSYQECMRFLSFYLLEATPVLQSAAVDHVLC